MVRIRVLGYYWNFSMYAIPRAKLKSQLAVVLKAMPLALVSRDHTSAA